MQTPRRASDRVREAVRYYREQRGWSLKTLEEKLGDDDGPNHVIKANSLWRLEQGERKVDPDDLVALAEALEVTPVDLLNGAPMVVSVELSGGGDFTVTDLVGEAAPAVVPILTSSAEATGVTTSTVTATAVVTHPGDAAEAEAAPRGPLTYAELWQVERRLKAEGKPVPPVISGLLDLERERQLKVVEAMSPAERNRQLIAAMVAPEVTRIIGAQFGDQMNSIVQRALGSQTQQIMAQISSAYGQKALASLGNTIAGFRNALSFATQYDDELRELGIDLADDDDYRMITERFGEDATVKEIVETLKTERDAMRE